MKLHDLHPARGSRRAPKRIGRGVGSGHGVTATKGTKGQKARAGVSMIPGFEGGQIRMVKRLPHRRGFTNPYRIEFETFNVGLLGRRFATGAAIDPDTLSATGMRTGTLPVKILGDGALRVALSVSAHRFSASAREKIQAAGGTVVELGIKTPQGKRRRIDADDVALTRGAPRRVRKPNSRAHVRATEIPTGEAHA
jgi:large subunit ribosomal protein L15